MKIILTALFLILLLLQAQSQVFFSKAESISTRLHPNQDIMSTLTKALGQYQLNALSVVSAVGSVRYCWLRFANSSVLTKVDGPLEITSLSGTFDLKMQPHIHIQLADGNGNSIGGHLPSLEERGEGNECPIFTTLEIVLLSHFELIYERKIDP